MKEFATAKSGPDVAARKSRKSNETSEEATGYRESVRDPGALSRRSHRDMILFVLVSSAFFHLRHLDLLAPLTESVRVVLGAPPPPALSTAALAGYTLSAAVLILARTANGSRPLLRWSHFGYRVVFYLFFIVSNSLSGHFMGVFIAGMLLYGLEHLNVWTYSRRLHSDSGKTLQNC